MTEDQEKATSLYDFWMKEIKAEGKAHKDWRARAKKVMERYTDEEKSEDARFNILWSNTEVLHAAVYGKTPNPDIRRRHKDKDPIAREISEVSERAVSYTLDVYDFDGSVDSVVDDYLLAGLGNARLRYTPYFEEGEKPVIPLGVKEIPAEVEDFPSEYEFYNGETMIDPADVIMGDEGPFMYGEPEEELVYQEVTCEPIPWNRFRWQPAKRWEDVDWAAIDHFLTRKELQDQFGDKAASVPLGYAEDGEKLSNEEDGKSRALVHEIFDKSNRKVIVIAQGCKDVLAEEDDPLELEGFYPFPKPLMATTCSDKLIPIPDYIYYQDQAVELDTLTQRIDKLTGELRYRGVYDGSFSQLQNVASNDDGEFTAVDDWSERFANGRSLDEAIKTMPLEELQRVIAALYQAREQVKQTIYEITGIADIMRGATKATETLGAQQLKTQFGSMRIEKRKRKVSQWVRDIIRLKVEVIVEHFDPKTLSLMSGKDVRPEMMQVMRDDLLRSYKIDIETDSTVTEDAAQERQDRIELLTSITEFSEKVGPAVQAGIVPLDLAKELLLFGVRGFKSGRQIEDVLESLGGDQEQGPNPEVVQMQQQMQVVQQQAQQVVQQMQQQMQEMKSALDDAQSKANSKAEENAIKVQSGQADYDIKLRELNQKERELALKEREVELKYQEPIEIAQAQSNAQLVPILEAIQAMIAQVSAPKRLVRDENGNAVGVETVTDAIYQ